MKKHLLWLGVPLALLFCGRCSPLFLIVRNANHNFKPTGGAIQPTRAQISEMMGGFFDRVLK